MGSPPLHIQARAISRAPSAWTRTDDEADQEIYSPSFQSKVSTDSVTLHCCTRLISGLLYKPIKRLLTIYSMQGHLKIERALIGWVEVIKCMWTSEWSVVHQFNIVFILV